MKWHAIAVQLDQKWKYSADLVNEYLRLFRFGQDWLLMRQDLAELLKCRGDRLDLLIGPNPGKRYSIAGPSGYPTVVQILYVSQMTIGSRHVVGGPKWQTSGMFSAF